jgi:hypothetical protein
MSKKDAAVYLRAAEILDLFGSGLGCCYAIHHVERRGYNSELQQRFKSVFKPRRTEGVMWWWEHHQDQTPRIIALCFAAAMAETGDL